MPGELHIEIVGENLTQLQNEAGGHRIQRIPPTEKRGRVHTSTVTVAVIDPSIQKRDYTDKDFRIEWFSGTGAGGQHRNKHQNSCRVIHIETGLVTTSQNRSRQTSLEEAKSTMIQLLQQNDRREKNQSLSAERKQQVGSGMRGDKIRTYRFQDDTVKDHNSDKTSTVSKVMRGYFDLLW